MAIYDDQINRWANPPSATENERGLNAIAAISETLKNRFGEDISFIRQGSHHNKTNVKHDSDIDLAVVHTGYYFPETSFLNETDKQLHKTTFVGSDYTFLQFKSDIHTTLQAKFGTGDAIRKNKCIRINGNSYRLNADVVPAFIHRRYKSYGIVSVEGIEFRAENQDRHYSFPEQHYEKGKEKNDRTAGEYKAVVRIFKNIRNELKDKGLLRVTDMSSFFIESLIWNVPDSHFQNSTHRENTISVAEKIYWDMQKPVIAKDYAEVSDLKYLLRDPLGRTPQQAQDFTLQLWQHITQ